MEPAVARRLWTLYEPIHAVAYFAPEVTAAWEEAGVRGFWRGYFAGRAAPLAPASAGVVTAAFFGFAPDMVARAIPSVWSLVTPERALDVRVAGAVAALDAALGPEPAESPGSPGSAGSPGSSGSAGSSGLAGSSGSSGSLGSVEEEAAGLLRAAVEAATGPGRSLFAANAEVAWPSGVRATLWHAATLLREHRGDGHVAACVAADLTGLEANVLAVAAGPLPAERFQQIRGWTPEEWAEARAGLADRGLVDPTGAITSGGRAVRAEIEAATDRAALRPWLALGPGVVTRLDALLAPIVARLLATDVIPDPNPIGVPRPT